MEILRDKDILFIIAGIGIVPARPFLRHLMETAERKSKIAVHYSVKTSSDILFAAEIENFSKSMHFSISHELPEVNPQGFSRRVADLIHGCFFMPENTIALIFGPATDPIKKAEILTQAGFLGESIFLWMERKMSCGVGHCRHCMIDHVFVCREGPLLSLGSLSGLHEVRMIA